jgi:hypothetical protein
VRLEDHTAVIRMVIDRHDDLVALRTQATCRLHVALREIIAGGAPRRLGANQATKLLRNVRPQSAAGVERKRLALELLADVDRLDRAWSTRPKGALVQSDALPGRRSAGEAASRGVRGSELCEAGGCDWSRKERAMTRRVRLALGGLLVVGTMSAGLGATSPAGAATPDPVEDVNWTPPRCAPNCKCWPDGTINWCLA